MAFIRFMLFLGMIFLATIATITEHADLAAPFAAAAGIMAFIGFKEESKS